MESVFVGLVANSKMESMRLKVDSYDLGIDGGEGCIQLILRMTTENLAFELSDQGGRHWLWN